MVPDDILSESPPTAPTDANTFISFTVSVWPLGQAAGSDAAAIGRSTSNVVSQVRQRKSYRAIHPA